MIDRTLKRALGRMTHGIQVVGATHDGASHLYTSHWVMQVSFDEPIVLASVSPRHDTHPLILASGRFSVSLLAGDQVEAAQYFSYPGRRFRSVMHEVVDSWSGLPVVRDAVAWLAIDVIARPSSLDLGLEHDLDHDLVLGRVAEVAEVRLEEPALTYSSRAGWRIAATPARAPGDAVRDRLLARLAAETGDGGEAAAATGDAEDGA